MKMHPLKIVILGLSITSSWGNGHATTYRGLSRELTERGHKVTFLERDVPWYAANRDSPRDCGRIRLYRDYKDLKDRFVSEIREAELVIVGSYVPDGSEIGEWVIRTAGGIKAFYDIDTPVTLAMLENGSPGYITRTLIPSYDLYLSFTGGPTLEILALKFGAKMPRAFFCSFDPAEYYPVCCEQVWDLGYMGTYSKDRQGALEELMLQPARRWQKGRFIAAGPMYPKETVWPANVARVHHLHPAEHKLFYGAQRFTLNITRSAMVAAGYSPSVRLFEAAGCGIPIISDYWDGIETIFEPDREILISRTADETLEMIRDMPETERYLIGERARLRVLSEHTAAHRAAQLEEYVSEVSGG